MILILRKYYHNVLAKKENGGLRASEKLELIKAHFMHLQDMHFITPLTLFQILSVPKIAEDITIFNRQ